MLYHPVEQLSHDASFDPCLISKVRVGKWGSKLTILIDYGKNINERREENREQSRSVNTSRQQYDGNRGRATMFGGSGSENGC